MLRQVLWLVWCALLAFAVIELTVGGFTDRIGDIGRLSALMSFALAQVVFLAFLLSGHFKVPSLLIVGVMRRTRRNALRAERHHESDSSRSLIDSLIHTVIMDSARKGLGSGPVLARSLETTDSADVLWPWQTRAVGEWLELSARAIEDSLVLRVLVPERTRAASSMLDSLAAVWAGYGAKQPVALAELERSQFGYGELLFADYVSALTGAIVLADATQTRAGLASAVRVWHSSSYSPQPSGTIDGTLKYGDLHGATETGHLCEWAKKLRDEDKTRAGDFDGPVLNVEAVTLTQDQQSGTVEFMLRTTETCYAATDLSPVACKGSILGDLADESRDAHWHRDATTMLISRAGDSSKRLNMLTVIASIILESVTDGRAQKSLLISKRSSTIRHGSSVHSMIGGVMNLSMGAGRGDVDSNGEPDPRAAIQREIEEELGLSIPARDLAPVAVYMFNQRDPSGGGAHRGQLLTTVSFTAHVNSTLEDVKRARAVSSAVSGRYELDDLDEIALPPIDEAVSDRQVARCSAAEEFAKSILDAAAHLDQAAMTSAVYACAEAYGLPATSHAFDQVWKSAWFQMPWASDLDQNESRTPRYARDSFTQFPSLLIRMDKLRGPEPRFEGVADAESFTTGPH